MAFFTQPEFRLFYLIINNLDRSVRDRFLSINIICIVAVRDSVDTVADMFFQLAPRQALSSDEGELLLTAQFVYYTTWVSGSILLGTVVLYY